MAEKIAFPHCNLLHWYQGARVEKPIGALVVIVSPPLIHCKQSTHVPLTEGFSRQSSTYLGGNLFVEA